MKESSVLFYSNQSCSADDKGRVFKRPVIELRVKTKNLREMNKLQAPNPNISGFGSISVKYSVAVTWNNISVILRS